MDNSTQQNQARNDNGTDPFQDPETFVDSSSFELRWMPDPQDFDPGTQNNGCNITTTPSNPSNPINSTSFTNENNNAYPQSHAQDTNPSNPNNPQEPPPNPSPPNNNNSNDEKITLLIQNSNNQIRYFRIKRTSRFELMFRTYAEIERKDPRTLRFLTLDGVRLSNGDCAFDKDMEDGDVILVLLEQYGGVAKKYREG